MATRLQDLRIRSKLAIIMVVSFIGLLGYAVFSWKVTESVRIEGVTYNKIIRNKDLVADILPPPAYIIESYLTVCQMLEARDSHTLDELEKRFTNLRLSFMDRHDYWIGVLPRGEIRDLMVRDSYDTAMKFYGLVKVDFIPAIQAGDYDRARELLNGPLSTAYREHRRNIDRVVELASAESQEVERDAITLIRWARIGFIAILALTLLATLGISWIMSRSITKATRETIARIKDIAEGEGDLTKRVEMVGRDEIGEMARYLNLTIAQIAMMIHSIRTETSSLGSVGGTLSVNVIQASSALNQIGVNLGEVKARIERQAAGMVGMRDTMGSIAARVEELDRHIENQSQNLTESSSSIEEMVASVRSVTEILSRNTLTVAELTSASDEGKSGIDAVDSLVQGINRESEGLLEASEIIRNIASQTSLLAMNAAIEAAHAGDYGRGFSVVADEIRKLAETSNEQGQTIATVLSSLKASIDKVAEASRSASDRFGRVLTLSRQVRDQEGIVKGAMDEQAEGWTVVLGALKRINEITAEVKSGSSLMLTGSHSVLTEVGSLTSVIQEITDSMNEMTSGTEQVSIAVQEVTDLSRKNSDSIGRLTAEVGRFRV